MKVDKINVRGWISVDNVKWKTLHWIKPDNFENIKFTKQEVL